MKFEIIMRLFSLSISLDWKFLIAVAFVVSVAIS